MSAVVSLVVASGNTHKVAELRAMLSSAFPGLTVRGLGDLEAPPEVEETAETFAGNAGLKARGIGDYLRSCGESGETLVLADDSGICVDVLEGHPGVRSARFAGETANDADNNAELVRQLNARGVDRSDAHYRCVLALCRVDGAVFSGSAMHNFEGRWPVQVRVESRGEGGFGYDPHAWIEQGRRTVAELSADEKAGFSHRGHALRALVAGWPLGT